MTDNDVKEMLAAANAMRKFTDSGVDDWTDCVWYAAYSAVYWNTEENVNDLFNQDGDTYSVEIGYKRKETESYVIYEQCYDGCGGRCTLVFSKSLKYNEDDWEQSRLEEEEWEDDE